MRVCITGATGFIGRHLVAKLEAGRIGYIVVSRNEDGARRRFPQALDVLSWDPPGTPPDPSRLEGLDAVIHLAGAPVAQRWTRQAKASILESRVPTTNLLAETLASLDRPPRVLISNSAIGYYGPRDDVRLDEAAAGGSDFLAGVCQQWEQAATPAARRGIRVVCPRVGIVLGPDGGALSLMLTPFRLGLGGPVGDGSQWMSWVHIDDVVGLMLYAMNTSGIEGPMNVTAPEPVRNREFSKALGAALHRPALIPTPVMGLRLLYGQFADILATGQRVMPRKALAEGYSFLYPNLEGALRAVLSQRN